MKKFKTRRKNNYIKIVIILVLLILFIFLSFIKLTKSHSKLVNILTKDFRNDYTPVFSLTNSLDYLTNSYSFKEKDNVYKEKNKKVYLYNINDLNE